MARLQLNKSSLAREQAALGSYERFLPALDLKRQQLMAARNRARAQVAELEAEAKDLAARVGREVPMLANADIPLDGLVHLKEAHLATENLVGTELPLLDRIDVETEPLSPFVRPHWVDDVARLLKEMLEARVRVLVAQRRVTLLDRAVDKVTQRVNLFDKVLIPRTRSNIRRIRIALDDAQMTGVARSKIAKAKRAGRSAQERGRGTGASEAATQ